MRNKPAPAPRPVPPSNQKAPKPPPAAPPPPASGGPIKPPVIRPPAPPVKPTPPAAGPIMPPPQSGNPENPPKQPPPTPPTPPSPNERKLMPVDSFTTLPSDVRKLTGIRAGAQANPIESGWAVPNFDNIPQSQMPLQPMTQSGQVKRLNPRTGMYEYVQSNRYF